MLGYFAAFVVTMVSFAVTQAAWFIAMVGFDRFFRFSPAAVIGIGLFWLMIIVLAVVPVALLMALIPLLASGAAVRLRASNGWYYAICGAVTGLLLSPIAGFDIAIASPTIPSTDPDQLPTFWRWFWQWFIWRGAMTQAPCFALSGAASGIAYWLAARPPHCPRERADLSS